MAQLQIDPLTPAIGAAIAGVDLSRPLDAATLDRIYQALLDHLVIFFRDQAITPDQQLAFAAGFGEIDQPHPIYPHVASAPQVVLLENGPDSPPDTNDWHTDLTFYERPPFASVLHAQSVPRTGGDTLWASMYAAYDALPGEVKRQVEGLSALHEMGDFRNGFLAEEQGVEALRQAMARIGCAVHPVVRRHPVTGRPFLYVNRSFTSHIVGQRKPESDRLLAYLFDHIDRPEFQVRFRWTPNALAFWDNRVTQHYAVSDYLPARRRRHRVTVIEDRRASGQGGPLRHAAG